MEVKKIGEIKAELEELGTVVTKETVEKFQGFIDAYRKDDRGGVQKIVTTAEKRLEKYTKRLLISAVSMKLVVVRWLDQ